jgi:O-acetyl-ADP-ribose deacetylase (regulator of RNase III)
VGTEALVGGGVAVADAPQANKNINASIAGIRNRVFGRSTGLEFIAFEPPSPK